MSASWSWAELAASRSDTSPAPPIIKTQTHLSTCPLMGDSGQVDRSVDSLNNAPPLDDDYWLESYEKRHAEIREYESPDDARIQSKREVFYAYVLRRYPDICKQFESLINTHME